MRRARRGPRGGYPGPGAGATLGRMTRTRRSPLALALALALANAACTSAPPIDPSRYNAAAVAATEVRIRGTWVLQTYNPATPLEPMLAALLGFQLGQMVITFDGQRAVATSPGVHTERTYRVLQAQGDQFQIALMDEQGVSYQAAGLFVGDNEVRFQSYTAPWKGNGSLRRSSGPAMMPLPPPP